MNAPRFDLHQLRIMVFREFVEWYRLTERYIKEQGLEITADELFDEMCLEMSRANAEDNRKPIIFCDN